MSSDRDRLAADLHEAEEECGVEPFSAPGWQVARIAAIAEHLIALGWTRLDEERHYVPAGLTIPGKSREDYIEEANESIRVLMEEREQFRNTLDVERLARALRPHQWADDGPVVAMSGTAEEVAAAIAKAYREDEG